MISIISELLFIIEYTNAPAGELSILLMSSCSSIPVLSAFHTASYIGKSFVNRHSHDSVMKASECGLGDYCGRQSRA
jgi:hypothetical protein